MKKGIRYILITVLGVIVLAGVIFGWRLMPFLREVLALRDEAIATIKAGSVNDFTSAKTSVVYDKDGEVIMTYSGESDVYYVKSDDIPQILKDSFVVMEDQKFYAHKGVDILAVLRAGYDNYTSGTVVSGASTITQQLVRNIYLNQDVNWDRKITEAFMALEIEKMYSKDEILEFYLNNIYFGNGYYGIGAAAQGYFGKSVDRLTSGECIFLSAIPNNPSRYNPISHEENTVARAKMILYRLRSTGMISDLDYLILNGEGDNPFVTDFNREPLKNAMNQSTADNYIYTYVTYCAVRKLMADNGFEFLADFISDEHRENYDEEYEEEYAFCQAKLYHDGYYIYTSIDMDAQAKLQKSVDAYIEKFDSDLSAAAMTIDNESGFVVAIVGGKTEEIDGYGLNRAYQSYRQPGSSIKPLNVFTPYLSEGHSSEEMVYDGYDENGPRNAGGSYLGDITLREAVKRSKNTIAWQIYRYLTPAKGTEYLRKLNFKRVYMDSKYLAGALGGFTYGVSVEEMTGGYAAIANDGVFRDVTCIRGMYRTRQESIPSSNENTLRVYSENGARQMTSILEDVINDGTGKIARLATHVAAGKTGTTNSNKDAWFVGYTAYYTTGVWVGYDMPREIDLKEGNIACYIWKDYMDALHAYLTPKLFTPATRVEPEVNDALTDLLRIPYEPEDGELEFANLWDNDLVEILEGDESAIAGGDENAVAPGDADATIRGGDETAYVGGDANAYVSGDENAYVGGDADAYVGGDANAYAPGDADATY